MIRFKNTGNKDYDNSIGIVSIILAVICFSSFFFFLSLLDSAEKVVEHWFEIILVVVMAISVFSAVFTKRAKLDKGDIAIDAMSIRFHGVKSTLTDVYLDIYEYRGEFDRYHIWDKNGAFAIYSDKSDELFQFLKEHNAVIVNTFPIIRAKNDSPIFMLFGEVREMSYNIETGHYYIKSARGNVEDCTPVIFALDARYEKV